VTVPITIPRVGLNTTEVTLVKWLVSDGESVVEGQPLYVVDADKVEVECESPANGRLRATVAEGVVIAIGGRIGEIVC
jgi:pyruvate/2-oxoglutarate dehydrogenase complex dihydrolipoamide acyltransferase (E2) component